jgi:hypothetical protein
MFAALRSLTRYWSHVTIPTIRVCDVRRELKGMGIKSLALVGVLGVCAPAFAASTVTGVISDSVCGASHDAMTKGGTTATDKQCTNGCVQQGAKYVVVENGKVLQVANQDFKELPTFAGDHVRVTGDIKGDTITITKIQKTE